MPASIDLFRNESRNSGATNVDDVKLGVIDADLLRHEIEADLGASSQSRADLLGLADVLVRLHGPVGIDDQALGGGIVGLPEQKLERNVLAERECQRQPRGRNVQSTAPETSEQRRARLKIEELGLQPGLLEQIEILGDENRRMVGGGNAVVEFKKLCRLLRAGNLRRERQRRYKEPRRNGPRSVHSLPPLGLLAWTMTMGISVLASSADVLAQPRPRRSRPPLAPPARAQVPAGGPIHHRRNAHEFEPS